ncbi:MAG: YbhB/YbcL family Raf kinase inhibitor-like protein [Thermoanaerobaculia bacterium]
MKIRSRAFTDREAIPPRYTCDGENVSPPFEFESIPGGTKSLALLVDDPDAPGGTFLHWLVWNIPPDTTAIEEKAGRAGGVLPDGAVEGTNGFGETGWGGPCPPKGRHRYEFHLYALKAPLDLPPGAKRDAFERAIDGIVLEHVSVSGTYERQLAGARR